uniref:Uncharacterized protein n=1 Tax=Monopterus albus TaxID=43700 RepID=A0A3Q3JKU8_MONAL
MLGTHCRLYSRPKTHLNHSDTRMEVSRRRILQKHLEPARPLRRFIHTQIGKQYVAFVQCTRSKMLRISYTREFLIELARCPEASKKPCFLPDHPVVLNKAVSCLESFGNGGYFHDVLWFPLVK